MKKNDEFYVSYIEGSLGPQTKKTLKRFVIGSVFFILIGVLLFSFFQKPFKNSSFELTSATKITGIYHENPYPMLRVKIARNTYKNILLLGFGKSSANPFLKKLRTEIKDLKYKTLSIEGNLIYYNGKTLLQITDQEKVILANDIIGSTPQVKESLMVTLQGEIIDPKCYFGVMKPGFGKIHRSCAVRCISGGIPPVFVVTDSYQNDIYYLLTDSKGNPIHESVLPFVGKPSEIKGKIVPMEDWWLFRIDTKDISIVSEKSNIY